MVSKTLKSQKKLSSSIEQLPDSLNIDGHECYLRIKRKSGENGKSGWFIRYISPLIEPNVNSKIFYEVKLQQRSEKLEKGAQLMLNKIKKL